MAAASVLVMVGAAVWAFQLGDDTEPAPVATPEQSVTELAVPRGAAKCMVPTAEVLRQQPLAFEGIVQAIEDGEAVLDPTRVFAGERTDLVRVQAPTSAEMALIGFVDFQVGERYLVAASDDIVTVCGFSGPATPELTALYDEAFPG